MRINSQSRRWRTFMAATALLALCGPLVAADPDVAVEVPASVPLEVVDSNFEESDFEPRGGALVIELAGSVRFRHTGPNAVRAVTLAVDAGQGGLGGRAAVALPSLNARNGDEFGVRVNLRLVRPLPLSGGPAVRIATDAVLFDTLAAAGPDRLNSVDKMKTRELEARRDREFFRSRWMAGGREALATAMQASLRRQAARPRLDIRLAGDGPATAARRNSSREIRLALTQDELAPLALERGTALVTGVVSDSPRILVRNRTDRTIRRFEIGWLVRDSEGTLYSVGAAPAEGDLSLDAGERTEVGARRQFEIRPVAVEGERRIQQMGAYLRSAQMDDGSVWIPRREALEASRLLDAVPVSAEELRLTQLYRERGPAVVVEELRRFEGDGAAAPVP